MTGFAAPSPAIRASGLEGATHSMLGLGALVDEMAGQGIAAAALLQGTGLVPQQLADPKALMSTAQKVTVLRNVQRLSAVPDVGLRAGCRQRLSDFGVWGYALASSATFGDAVLLGIRHIKLAGPVLEKRFRVEGDAPSSRLCATGRHPAAVQRVLVQPILKLGQTLLGSPGPLPGSLLRLPYPRPAHAAAYERVFGGAIEFDAGAMEWHFDAAALRQPLPNANPITAGLCAQFCERMVESLPEEEDSLARRIRAACLSSGQPSADEMAQRRPSLRTCSGGWPTRAKAKLSRRGPLARVPEHTRCRWWKRRPTGFSEVASFRKAFRKWTGNAPSHYRERAGDPPSLPSPVRSP